MAGFLDGLDRYRHHPYRRPASAARPVWAAGGARLLDYGGGDAGTSVLLIASLVNRAYILDLLPHRSLAAFLSARGIRTFVLDWGDLAGPETEFDLGDFLEQRLVPVLDAIHDLGAPRPALAGYCMGGNLALALALRRPRDLAGLAVLATPWDFHAEAAAWARALAVFAETILPGLRALGALPLDLLQALFAGLDPLLAYRKFRRFAALPEDSDEALVFVALEDWLNDGVALPWRVAAECLIGWYGENRPARGEWSVRGLTIRPEALALPSLAIVPAADRIVPPASALALAEALPGCTVLRASAGHIGMMAGSRARAQLWEPLAAWIGGLPARA